jgi:hypothetical protein
MNPVPIAQPDGVPDEACQRLLDRLADTGSAWQRLVLSKPAGAEPGAHKLVVRPLQLRGQACLSFVSSYATRDETKNLPTADGLARVAQLLGSAFRHAHLFTAQDEWQLTIGKRGTGHLAVRRHAAAAPAAVDPAPHDREKQRWIAIDRPFLVALGITTPQHQLVPAMARKWKQINKFIEVFAHALERSPLQDARRLRVVDFGAGKAYLSFAIHDWLRHSRGIDAQVTGVELRADLVQQGQQTIDTLALEGMHMQAGDVRSHNAGQMDVMIALHACDTATDHAIHLGLQAGAQIILCSPCCHKQLRPQLLSPGPLRSVFQHGIHAEQQAEMLTDSLRALLLESQGYDAQVFQFVALEHTQKNKMILAVKRAAVLPAASSDALQKVTELKRYFGIQEHCLESLLNQRQALGST